MGAAPTTSVSVLGRLLREWRHARGFSQLDLATLAGISSKHLSFVETGRAQPGRDVVLRLASALDLPLRDRNAALMAAGYAPLYGHTSLDAPEMVPIVRAVDFILRQQEPYPCIAMDRLCNVYKINRGAEAFLRVFLGPEASCGPGTNLFRLLMVPHGLRPHIVNRDDVARFVIFRLRREVSSMHGNVEARAFLEEMLSQPGLPADVHVYTPEQVAPPVVPTEFQKDGRRYRLFNTVTTLGTPQDVTLQELRLESSFPADAETDAFLRSLTPQDAAALPAIYDPPECVAMPVTRRS